MLATTLVFGAAAVGTGYLWAGIIVFAAACLLIASGKIDKATVAILGVGLMVALGVAKLPQLLGGVDLNVIGLLIGMMVIANLLATTGVFEYLAAKIARQNRGNGILVTIEFLVATAFISAFLGNVSTMILMIPVTILIAQLLRLPVPPLLIGEAIFANIGGMATLTGSPVNILIGGIGGFTYNDFLRNLAPITLLLVAVLLSIFIFTYRKQMRTTPGAAAQVGLTEPRLAILEPVRLSRVLWVFGFLVLGFLTSGLTGVGPGLIALCGALIMTLICGVKPQEMLAKVNWSMILLFVGLFMMVRVLEIDGVFLILGESLVKLTGGNLIVMTMIVLWGCAFLSLGIYNIPLVVAMIPLIHAASAVLAGQTGGAIAPINDALFWALALGAGLGGIGSIISSPVNEVVMQAASRNRCQVTFVQFARCGLPLMLLSLVLSSIYLYWRYL